MVNNNLKVRNMVFAGKMPFKRKLSQDELKNMVEKGNMIWITSDTSPIIQTFIEKDGFNIKGKTRSASIQIWTSGAINIVGVTSKKEADNYYNLVLEEIRKTVRDLL